MKKYVIVYEDERMKNEKESYYEYSECEQTDEFYDTLEEAQKEFNKFKGYLFEDNKHLYRRIATLNYVEIEDEENLYDYEVIDMILSK